MGQLKRVGFILDSGAFGGAERQAFILATQLKQHGFEVIFFYLKESKSELLNGLLKEAGIKKYDLGFVFKSTHVGRFFYIIPLLLKLRSYQLDILMPYTIRPNVNINFAWQLTGAKISIWNQRDEGRGFGGKYRDKILWFALKNTSGFISNSLDGMDFLKDYLPVPKSIKHIRNGVVSEPFPPKAEKKQTKFIPSDATFTAVMVANLTRYKDHFTLLKAWKLVQESLLFGQKPVLILAGAKNETYPELSEITNKENLNIQFVGQVANVSELLGVVDISVFSSFKEGVPNGVLESMAIGKLVVASDIRGNVEALGPDYPLFFKTGDPDDLFDVLKKYKENAKVSEHHSFRLMERIQTLYSPEKLMQETINYLNEFEHGAH